VQFVNRCIEKMCNLFGERLLEERKRLGFTQDEMAARGGVAKRTYCNYEAGERDPTGGLLSALASLGVDIQYILTGERTASPALTAQQAHAGYSLEVLSREEQALLDNYRHAPEIGKKAVEAAIAAVAQPGKMKSRSGG
jgi:transcriptional regulator with XRE-family HTH domain